MQLDYIFVYRQVCTEIAHTVSNILIPFFSSLLKEIGD